MTLGLPVRSLAGEGGWMATLADFLHLVKWFTTVNAPNEVGRQVVLTVLIQTTGMPPLDMIVDAFSSLKIPMLLTCCYLVNH